MKLESAIGLNPDNQPSSIDCKFMLEYANLKLAALDRPVYGTASDYPFMKLAEDLLGDYQEKTRLLSGHLCPVDQRIQNFLQSYLGDLGEPVPVLPSNNLMLDRHGLARILSIPPDSDRFESDIVSSYRVHQGVLHNPANDRRTTKGVFHVAEGGLPIPADKKAVPRLTFLRLLAQALQPPEDLLQLPFTSTQEKKCASWVSLLLRPTVLPEVPGSFKEKKLEVRFFAPGNLLSNLDFVESIFGNAGNPFIPENDSGLDVEHWTGHSGCVILAPHLTRCTKKALGLPNIQEATEQQKADGMCWADENERYNDGSAFKLTARDKRGVVVTLIADNYFGYCKKEVKTQISFSANLYGLAEEEHAGGAIAYPSYDLGEDFRLNQFLPQANHTFAELITNYGEWMELQPEGYGIDKNYATVHYIPEDAYFNLDTQSITWNAQGKEQSIHLKPGIVYVLPCGYKVEMIRPHESRRWRLIGTTAEGIFCHKPCTVSGGGKSEISKPITDAILHGAVIVADFNSDMDKVAAIIDKEFGQRFKDETRNRPKGRPLLSPDRSLGSVVKLLTPSRDYKDAYNQWLETIPYYIKELVFVVKRFYKPDWENWRERFKVDLVNGTGGNELKYRNQKLITQYLRVGFTEDGSWRTFGLRKDFIPAVKLQTEDDISAAVVMPADRVSGKPLDTTEPSIKLIENCEYRLFQRPDDAIIRGYDKRTELDMSQPGNFFSNYEPLDKATVRAIREDTIRFEQYTQPIKDLIQSFLESDDSPAYLVLPSHPRIVDGKPSKNPRYLQTRDDLVNSRKYYLGKIGMKLFRRLPADAKVPQTVNAVLPGRRNNPPEPGIRSLAVFNPIHYMPLPEFFMEVISSMTGKSPSTTGAGSEGALTKGPFNALPPIIDLNGALVSFMITGYHPFITAAGYVGPKYRIDHDVSLLVPEIWSRLTPEERDPKFLIDHGFFEAMPDMECEGKTVQSSILGYRMTDKFMRRFFGRVFANPNVIFNDEMLRPEIQDMATFTDGMANILATHKRVAAFYFQDNSIEMACPPLKALLHIMAHGHYEGKKLKDPEIRQLFDRKHILNSEWYRARLNARKELECKLWETHIAYLHAFLRKSTHAREANRLQIADRLLAANQSLEESRAPDRTNVLMGTIGMDPHIL